MSDIKGTNGDDILTGTGNDDIFNGGAGADTLDGGAGKDMALYWDSPEGVTIDLSTVDGDGYALGAGGHAYGDRLKNIEQLWGSDHGDFLMGGSQDNLLLGGGGADALHGGAGDDFLGGGKGDDDLSGGPGADTLDGGAGKDSALYLFSESGVSINLSGPRDADGFITARGGNAKGDKLKGVEDLWGSFFADRLKGDGKDNVLNGNFGNDKLYGEGGNDLLIGEAGRDLLKGGQGADVLKGGYDDDKLFGGRGADVLEGGYGEDVLDGGRGKDVLDGGPGKDVLIGGSGHDVFRFSPGDAGTDLILDFDDGTDSIDLTAFDGVNSMDDLDVTFEEDAVNIGLSGDGGQVVIILVGFAEESLDSSDFLF